MSLKGSRSCLRSKLTLSVLSAAKARRNAAAYPYSGNWYLKRWPTFLYVLFFTDLSLMPTLFQWQSKPLLFFHFSPLSTISVNLISTVPTPLRVCTHWLGVGLKSAPPLLSKNTATSFSDFLMHQFDTLRENPKTIDSNFFELNRVWWRTSWSISVQMN